MPQKDEAGKKQKKEIKAIPRMEEFQGAVRLITPRGWGTQEPDQENQGENIVLSKLRRDIAKR